MLQRAAQFVLGGAAAAVDRAVTLAVNAQARSLRPENDPRRLDHAERLERLGELADRYSPDVREHYFREPRAILPAERVVRSSRDRRVLDLSWSSEYSPLLSELSSRYGRHVENHVAAARLFLSNEPRPVA